MRYQSLVYLFFSIILFSCSPKPFKEAQKIHEAKIKDLSTKIDENLPPLLVDSTGKVVPSSYVPTVNFNIRKPNFVIIHHTAQDSLQQTINTFIIERTQVSSHYVIGKDGQVVQMLNDDLRAWHAGLSKWGNITDMNSCSLGIELDNNGTEPFSEAQINSLLLLLAKLKKDYAIPTSNFIGHSDVAPKRKTDPSIYFPWDKLAKKGFGFWYDIPDLPPPTSFDVESALRRIGYDTSDFPAAVVAFKRHFIQTDIKPTLSLWDKCVLYNLYRKY